ncbi:hypothetical protein Q1J61_21420 [Pseudomonas putida]
MDRDMKKATMQTDSGASVRFGWGGMLALDRKLLDLVLQEQYLEALANFGAMDAVDLEAYLDEGERISVSFQGLVLGAPQVSFENATWSSPDLTVRMNIVAGEYMRMVHLPGSPKRVVESFTITEAMGFWVGAPLPLRGVRSKSRRFTLLELDLASAVNFSTNLGPNDYVNSVLGLRLREAISYMRAYQRTYSLGSFVMDDYYPLSPVEFMVRTLPAPWGQSEGSPRHGDGAVLVFMQLGIDLRPGGTDPGIDYPYPIAEDAPNVPGTLILVPDIRELGAGQFTDVLNTFSLPGGLEFVPGPPIAGVDLVVRGNWRKKQHALTVEPAFTKVVAGKSMPFTADGATGPVQWSAINLKRPGAIGSFSGASYSPRPAASFVEDQQMVLVTATSPETGGEGRSHALVIESARAVHVAPRVATWVQGEDPIELRATSIWSGTLQWTLVGAALLSEGEQRVQTLDEPIGDLDDKGDGRAIFTPYPPGGDRSLFKVQRIRCTNRQTGESAESAVVVIRWHAGLNVVPFHVGQARSVQPTPFTVMSDDFSQDLGSSVTWTVNGEGEFDGSVYMPPENPQLPIAVVTAVHGAERAGYAIVEFSEGRQATAGLLSWEALSTFELRAIGAPQCFANGWQQIEVEVSVAAADDQNGQPVNISDADMATLKFLNEGSNNDLPFLAPMEEALGSDDPGGEDWAVNRDPNNIQRQVAVNGGSSAPLQARTRRFFLHSRTPGVIRVIASIQNTVTGKTVTSSGFGEKGRLELRGQDLPSFTQELYSFKRTRVAGDSSPSDGDEFAYVDRSTDNWLLEHVLRAGQLIKFARLFISDADNKSGVRWSWQPGSSTPPIKDDDFVSYTGFSFESVDRKVRDDLVYDGLLYRMSKQRGYALPPLAPGRGPGAGQLMLTLKRDTGFVLESGLEDPGYRRALEKDLIFTLLDMEGNLHPLTFAFAVTAEEERQGITHRDVLKLSIR